MNRITSDGTKADSSTQVENMQSSPRLPPNRLLPAALPVRVQRKRSKGWKMPENTVYVGRGTMWCNPFVIKKADHNIWVVVATDTEDGKSHIVLKTMDKKEAVRFAIAAYEHWLLPYSHEVGGIDLFFFSVSQYEMIKEKLKGKNLACWCRPDEECHADILLKLANG